MTDWRSIIIVLALFGVLLSASATEHVRSCAESDKACRERAPWYAFPIARMLDQVKGQSSLRTKTAPAVITSATPFP